MNRLFATYIVSFSLAALPIVAAADSGYDHQPKPVAVERTRGMHIADGDVTSSVSASGNRDSIFARNEVAGILKGDDPESLRLELLACLLIMVIAPVGALLMICYIDHLTTRRNTQAPDTSLALGVPMNMESPKTK